MTAVDSAPDDDECEFLTIDLMVHDVQNLLATNIVLSYPSDVVAFSAASGTSSVLSSGNTAIEVKAAATGADEATIAITRLSDTGIDVPDDGVADQVTLDAYFDFVGSPLGGSYIAGTEAAVFDVKWSQNFSDTANLSAYAKKTWVKANYLKKGSTVKLEEV